jgi:hypothetical protein
MLTELGPRKPTILRASRSPCPFYSAALRLLALLAFAIALPGCERHCDKPVGEAKALQVAREYFLSRSIAGLASGADYERKIAGKLTRAGVSEQTYKALFSSAIERSFRREDACDQPRFSYEARESVAHLGYEVYFYIDSSPVGHPQDDLTIIGINITTCGEFAQFLGVYHDRADSTDSPACVVR